MRRGMERLPVQSERPFIVASVIAAFSALVGTCIASAQTAQAIPACAKTYECEMISMVSHMTHQRTLRICL